MQAFNNTLIVSKLVARYINHGTHKSRVISGVHVDLGTWERNVFESLFHLLGPLLHQIVYIWHLFSVVDSGRGPCLMQILHAIYPARDLLGFLVGVLNRFDVHRSCTHDIALLNVSQFNHCFIFWVQGGLVQNSNTQVFLGTIWLWHLQEGINFTHGRDVLRDKRLQFGVKVDLLRLVSLNILKELFHFT